MQAFTVSAAARLCGVDRQTLQLMSLSRFLSGMMRL